MEEAEGKAVFEVLRPLCVKVMSEPSVKSVSRLQAGVRALPSGTAIPHHLVAYLTLPLRAAIKRAGSSNERLLESSLLTMADMLSHVRNMDLWELFDSMFTFLCMLLDSKMAKEAGFTSLSEELYAACLKLLKELLLCSVSSIHKQLFGRLVSLGHCISTLLACVADTSSNALRREALSSLCALTGLHTAPLLAAARLQGDPYDLSQAVDSYLSLVRDQVGVGDCGCVLASFLPGVVTGVTKLLTSDANAVESVVSLGLVTWARYVVLVMGGAEGEEPVLPPEEGRVMVEEGRVKMVDRTRAWREETAVRLNVLIQRISVLMTSEVWRVRLQLVGWAHSLLHHCSWSLEVCVPGLLEVLVTLSHDPYQQVSLAAHSALEQFPGGGSGLSSLLSQQLHTLVTSLPRLIRQHDDNKKVVTLQLLAGYLGLPGGHVVLMVHSLPHLSCLVQALVQTLTLQQRSPHVVALSLPTLDPASLTTKPLPLVHAHFSSEKVAVMLYEVCHLLGCHGDLVVLVDYVLDQCHAHPHFRCEYFLFLSRVLRGAKGKGCGQNTKDPTHKVDLIIVIENVVTQLVSPDTWSHDLKSDSVNSDLYSFLLLNTIYTCVHVLGVNFDPLLQQTIYPLMQKLGDTNVGVANAAMATLQSVCHLCGYEALPALIGQNADYLVHATSVHLRHAPHVGGAGGHAQAIQVLGAVMRHGDEGVCHMMKDCVNELLVSLDTRQLPPPLVWAGLQTLAESCECWVSKRKLVKGEESEGAVKGGEEGGDSDRKEVGIQAIADFFLHYHEQKDKQEEEGVEVEGEGPEEEEPYSQEAPLPAVEQICVDVMRRCGHHMSHDNPNVRMVVMETLQHCMKALRHEKLTLYPEVHTVWLSLLPRLTDPAPPVSRRAWQVVMCMCEVCGDFVRRRVLEKVWPVLLSSLETTASASANSDTLYSQSAKCKLQCVQLECVGSLAVSLSLPSVPLELGGVATITYLSRDQPHPLQEAASHTFRQLIRLDAHMTWLLLQQMVPPPPATPPHSSLRPYKFPSHPDAEKYVENVSPLLSLTFDVT